MRLRPVWASLVAGHDALEAFEKKTIWYREAIRSGLTTEGGRVSTPLPMPHKRENALPLSDSNPARPLTIAGTEPDIIGIGEAYFDAAVGSQAA